VKMDRDAKHGVAVGGAVVGAAMLAKGLDEQFAVSDDVARLRKLVYIRNRTKEHIKNNDTMADIWETTVDKYKNKPALIFEGRDWSFLQVDAYANQVAHWLSSQNFQKGQIVALLMENRPEFVATWMGVLKAGGACALINTNLKDKPLIHSLSVSGAHMLVSSVDLCGALMEIREALDLEPKMTIWTIDGISPISQDLDAQLARLPNTRPPRKTREGVKFTDTALLVYTSGTTGLPKAGVIRHSRLFTMGSGFIHFFGLKPEDRVYCCLPLYHSAGGCAGMGVMVIQGASFIIKRKFSNSQFWTDCRDNNATVVQYIGELCRYLLGAPPSPNDTNHHVRIAVGNGLRADIWDTFQKRFNVPQIGEFYGSTEGHVAMLNLSRGSESQGSIGRMGPLMQLSLGFRVVKFDVVNEVPIRGPDGHCIEVEQDEPGELIAKIVEGDPLRGFAGYHGNKKATNQKLMADVFKKGDLFFRTGDLIKYDAKRYWYFVDRIGDTFRWNGENVSTTEVAQMLGNFPGIEEVNVYGVEVPHHDGRACMAAIVANDKLNLEELAKYCQTHLPSYAIPLFLRFLPRIETTSTFKHQKVDLRSQGVDPEKCKSESQRDALWRFSRSEVKYVPFTKADFQQLQEAGPEHASRVLCAAPSNLPALNLKSKL